MTQRQSTTLTLSIILVLAVLGGAYFMNKNNSLNGEIDKLQANAMEFAGLKSGLISEIEELQSEYDDLLQSNAKLQSSFTEIVQEMINKDREIEKIKASSSNESSLVEEISRLRMLKQEYAFVLNELRLQAIILNDSNNELQRQNSDLRNQVMAMKRENERKMQSQTAADEELMGSSMPIASSPPASVKTTLSEKGSGPNSDVVVKKKAIKTVSIKGAKANNFSIEVRNKKMKITDETKKVRKISVRFEVDGLAGGPKGTKRLYLVVKDPKGTTVLTEHATRLPLSAMEDIKAKPIMAQQVMSSTLKNNKSLKFEFLPLHKALIKGTYTAYVYSEEGLMGSQTFSLR